MGRACIVKKCKSNSLHKSVFSYNKKFKYQHKWIKFIEDEGLKFSKTGEYNVCENHFKKEMIIQNSSRMTLKADAYPMKVRHNQLYL